MSDFRLVTWWETHSLVPFCPDRRKENFDVTLISSTNTLLCWLEVADGLFVLLGPRDCESCRSSR